MELARAVRAKKPKTVFSIDGCFASFDALTTFTPEVAELLVQYEGALSFNGLTELLEETAAALAKHAPTRGFGSADFRFNGLKTISPTDAEALATHQGKVLLHSLEKLGTVIRPGGGLRGGHR